MRKMNLIDSGFGAKFSCVSYFNFVLAFVFVSLFSGYALAQESEKYEEVARYETDKTFRDPKKVTGTGVALFLGLDAGALQTTPEDPDIESKKFGPALFPNLNLSIFSAEFALDLGAGFFYSNVLGSRDVIFKEGKKPAPEEVAAGTADPGEEVTNQSVVTSAAGLYFSARRKLGQSFEIGPAALGLLTGDSSFAIAPPESRNAVFAGLAAYFNFGKKIPWKLGAKAFIDVNLHERNVFLGLFSVQVGIPLRNANTIVREKRSMIVQEKTNTVAVEKTVEKILVRENVRFLFEEQIINFEFDKSILTANSKMFLQNLGQFLGARRALFDSVFVEGHTDNRGTVQYNQLLSEKRALAVKQEISLGGVPLSIIQSKGMAATNPVDPENNDLAWARNRRVEIVFLGVRDPTLLREAIDKLKKLAKAR